MASLMGDEGVGVHVVRRLLGGHSRRRHGRGWWHRGFHLLSCFQDYDRLVLIDAAADGRAPGTVSTFEPVYASDYPRSLTARRGLRTSSGGSCWGLPRL
jgi:hydrogenase maturation protease